MEAWIVRSDGGEGIDAFETEGFVGLRGGTGESVVDTDLSHADEAEISAAVKAVGLGAAYTRMLRSFVLHMAVGDLVVTPGPLDREQPEVLIGQVVSDYRYEPGANDPSHRRRVQWSCRVARDEFPASFWRGAVSAITRASPDAVPSCD